jgi:hypothetical protein
MALDPETLCRHIRESFGPMPYPGDDKIVSGYNSEDKEILRLLKGHHCQEVSWLSLDLLREELILLTPEGFRFYLPAFMLICLLDYYRADVTSSHVTVQAG